KVKQPCGSRSTSSTRRPSSTIAAPSEATVVVLATPPFWLATANTRVLLIRAILARSRPVAKGFGFSGPRESPAESLSMGLHNHRLVLLRPGETAWSKSGQHTGRTDIELTDTGRVQAELAGRVLRELELTDPIVFSSPRIRALTTAKLAGLAVDEV